MKSPWTPSRDKQLLALQAKGRSAAEIAKTMGTSRNAVIGRSIRLRGIVYESSIASWKRANAKKSAAAKERAKARTKLQRKVMQEMGRAIAGGMHPAKAMGRAFRAGAMWRQIGDHFGITPQAAYERARAWTKRNRR
jgi:GcrA cell cycle regulator